MVKKTIITVMLSLLLSSNPVSAYVPSFPPNVIYEVPDNILSARYNFRVSELLTVNPEKVTDSDHSLIVAQNSKYLLAITRETNEMYYSELEPQIEFKGLGKIFSAEWLSTNFLSNALSIKSAKFYDNKLYVTAAWKNNNSLEKCAYLVLISIDVSNLRSGIEPKLRNHKVLFQGDCDRSASGMWGGALAVNSSGIYLALGDNRFDWKTGKELLKWYSKDQLLPKNTFNGKILFWNSTNPTINKKPIIFASGFRNPYGLQFIKIEGRKVLAITDIGPEGGDELNIVKKGLDYGWPKFNLGRQYDLNNPDFNTNEGHSWGNFNKSGGVPIWSWLPSSVPTQFIQVPTNTSLSDWSENLIVATLAGTLERLVVFNGNVIANESIKFPTRVRNIVMLENDTLIVTTDDGRLYSLVV